MNDTPQSIQPSLSPDALFIVLCRVAGLFLVAQAACSLWSALIAGVFGSALASLVGQVGIGFFLVFGAHILQRAFCPVEPIRPRG